MNKALTPPILTARFEDPQREQAREAHQGEITRVAWLSGGDQHRLELQMGQPQGRGLRWHPRAAHVLLGSAATATETIGGMRSPEVQRRIVRVVIVILRLCIPLEAFPG